MATTSKWSVSNFRWESGRPRWVVTYNWCNFQPTNRGVQGAAWNFFITTYNLYFKPWSSRCPVWVSTHLHVEIMQGQGLAGEARASSLLIGVHGCALHVYQLGCHIAYGFGGPCAMCGIGCHDSACMHNTAISSWCVCNIYPCSHTWQASSSWSPDISLWID